MEIWRTIYADIMTNDVTVIGSVFKLLLSLILG